jgi:hypothetical protein
MNVYQLLSELYRIIGETDRRTIELAGAREASPEIRTILGGLLEARIALETHWTQDAREHGSQVAPRAFEPDLTEEPEVENASSDDLLRWLVAQPRDKMAELATHAGFRISLSYFRKASKRVLVERMRADLQRMGMAGREQTLRALRSAASTDQTRGWLDVIRRGGG